MIQMMQPTNLLIINTKKINKMKILANATITKLREYSQSYGSEETLNIPFIKVYEKEIQLFNELGNITRKMRIGTKVLKSFNGHEITERTFNMRTKKNLKQYRDMLASRNEEAQRKADELNNLIDNYASLIDKVDGEDYAVTAGRLSAKLDSKIDSTIFHKAVKMIRNR